MSENERILQLERITKLLQFKRQRATYDAVGELLGIPAQNVGKELGDKNPQHSWVVNGDTGQPVGYTESEKDDNLPPSPIRTAEELARWLGEFSPVARLVRAAAQGDKYFLGAIMHVYHGGPLTEEEHSELKSKLSPEQYEEVCKKYRKFSKPRRP